MDMTLERMDYLQYLIEQMYQNDDDDILFSLYKEVNRTYKVLVSELLTKEPEDAPLSIYDIDSGNGATIIDLAEARKNLRYE